MRLAVAFVIAGTVTTHASADTVGMAVVGDPALANRVSASIGDWLARNGHQVSTPLDAATINTVNDCFVVDADDCARNLIAQRSTATSFVFVGIETTGDHVTLRGRRFVREKLITETATCDPCGESELRHQVDQLMVALVGASAAPAPAPPAPSAAVAITLPPRADRRGLAIGAELGEPTAATAGLFIGKLAVTGAFGTGTFAGAGPTVHAELRYEVVRPRPTVSVRVGLGGRYYHHGYDAASIDEVPDSHYGVRVLGELAFDRGPLQLYAELAPGVDLERTQSCTLRSGVDSICPHAQAAPVFVDFAIGARWFLSH
jgi:hypothetical protein